MKDFVVCIADNFHKSKKYGLKHPIKGEIYKVERLVKVNGKDGYFLFGFNEIHPPSGKRLAYSVIDFRPVDDSFGELVESEIMKDVELEPIEI